MSRYATIDFKVQEEKIEEKKTEDVFFAEENVDAYN